MSDPIGDVSQAKQAALATQVQTAVVRKQLDAAAQQGEAVNQLLDASAKMSKAQGCGGNFDAVG